MTKLIENEITKRNLGLLLEALDASPLSLRLDECRDYKLQGRRGRVYCWGITESSLGQYYIHITAKSAKHWTWIKRDFAPFARCTQDGDEEGAFHLARLPTPSEAEIIRDRVGLTRAAQLTEEARSTRIYRLKNGTIAAKHGLQ